METRNKFKPQGIFSSKFLQKIVSSSTKVTPKGKVSKPKFDLSAINLTETNVEIVNQTEQDYHQGPSTERSAISITETIKKKRKDLNIIEAYLTRDEGSQKPMKRSTSEKNLNPPKQSSKPLKTQTSEKEYSPSVQKGFVNTKKGSKIKHELKEIFSTKLTKITSQNIIERKFSKGSLSSKLIVKNNQEYQDPLQLKEEAYKKEKLREKRLFRFYALNRKVSNPEKLEKIDKKDFEDESTGTTISYYKVEGIDV